MSKRPPIPLLIAALGLLVLPPVLLALGLTMTSATEVVIYALACTALNILVGHTGLVSFGHGAWFGLAAYAAALLQRNWMHDSFFGPTVAGVLIAAVVAAAFGFLILRRRGVYFSLLTLALAAMLYAVSFPRRHHAADAVRPQPRILDRLLLVCRWHRIPDADPVMAFP